MVRKQSFLLIPILILILSAASYVPAHAQAQILWQQIFNRRPQQKQRTEGKIFGIVVATPAGQEDATPTGVPEAQILVKGTKGTATGKADKEGTFHFKGLPPDEYIITATKPGVGTGTVKFTLGRNETKKLEPILLTTGGSIVTGEGGVILPDSVYVVFDGSEKPVGPDDIQRLMPGPPSPGDRFMPPAGISEVPTGSKKNPTRQGRQPRPNPDGDSSETEDYAPPTGQTDMNGNTPRTDNKLMIIDPQGGNRIEPVPIDGKPSRICFNPAGTKLYVASDLNQIQVIDTLQGNTPLGRVALPAPVFSMALSPDGTRLYVICVGESKIQEIDTKALTVASTFTIPPAAKNESGMPTGLAINKEGTKLYVTISGIESAEIAIFDTFMRVAGDTNRIPIESQPTDIAMSEDGSTLYVIHANPGRVSVVPLAARAVGAVIPLQGTPTRVASAPDGSRAYVTCRGSNTVAVVPNKQGMPVKTIAAGKEPTGIAITNGGKRVYVMNTGDGTVSVIDTTQNYVIMNTRPQIGFKPTGAAVKP